jgi:hypothetical protein
MLQCSGELVYVNEPLNPGHPPGRSPGVLDAEVTHRFQYIDPQDDSAWRRAFTKTTALRYGIVAELRKNHRPYDLARMLKYSTAFTWGRLTGRSALIDDPFALFSTPWFATELGCRVVVLARDPVSFTGSWDKLGWDADLHELLGQPALVRDLLAGHEDELNSLVTSQDRPARISQLWRTAYDVVDQRFRSIPGVAVIRYEDLAADPLPRFEELYANLGLTWTDSTRQAIARATSGEARATAFSWSLSGGMSRTAFQPMDSRVAIATARRRLPPEIMEQVWNRTADVARRFGYES